MDEEMKSLICKMQDEIKDLNNRVEELEAKEEFDGNIIFDEPVRNKYNR